MTDGDNIINALGVDVAVVIGGVTTNTKAIYYRTKRIQNTQGIREVIPSEHVHVNAVLGELISKRIGLSNSYTIQIRSKTYRFVNYYVNQLGNYVLDVEEI